MTRRDVPRLRAVLLALLVCAAGAPEPGESDLFAQADDMLQKVSGILDLKVERPVRKEMTTRKAVQDYLRRQMSRQLPGRELHDLGEALQVLGLLPDGYDLGEGVVDLFSEQVAGFYDPERGIFYVADWVPPALQVPTLAHELVHALQDQHYDLSRLLRPTPGEQDADMAFQALVEGQGVAVMTEVMAEPMGLSLQQVGAMMQALGDPSTMLSASQAMGVESGALRTAPPFLLSSLMFPYTEGMQFFLAFLADHSWAEAGMLFRDPPASTEEILHPEKYFGGRDRPQAVEAKALEEALPAGWKVFFRERLGEFTLREMFSMHLERDQAAAAAAGWGSDRTLIARTARGERMLLQRSIWDSPQDAREYFAAWVALARKRHPTATPLEFADNTLAAWATPAGGIRIAVDGASVTVVEGVPSEMWARLFPEDAP